MKKGKEVKISYWAHHLTTIISVTLVLVLMGIIALVWIGADHETRRLKERIELSVVMRDSVSQENIKTLADEISRSGYARDVRVISKEEALSKWTAETGEDLEEVFGVNPMSEEITFCVSADHASAAAIAGIKGSLEKRSEVEGVSSPDGEMVESMNRNIARLTLILGGVGIIMLIISFVLINNTVHLTIYSRRFTIHTMKLVGATNGFIRKPIILNNMLAGFVAGFVADAVLAACVLGAGKSGLPDLVDGIGVDMLAIVGGGVILAGAALCGLASCFSANAYLRKDYDRLFR